MDELVADATRRLRREFEAETDDPLPAAVAPGRTNLVGGHTDYNDGFVLPVAIDRRTAVVGRARDDDRVRVHSTNYDETASFAFDEDPLASPQWAHYVQGVAWALRADGVDLPGADLVVDGNVPQGAGLASSAALEVATGELWLSLAGEERSPESLAAICRRAENEFVGVSCGIMDQLVAATGRRDSALFLDCRSGDVEHYPLPTDRIRVVVTDTRVSHSLVDSAYNDRLATCESSVADLDAAMDRPVEALRDVDPADLAAHGDVLDDTELARSRHVVTENRRVQDAAAALSAGDLETVGELMLSSHESLRVDYEVSCAELDRVVRTAEDHEGALGARMTGAGFGGCVTSLVRPEAVDAFASAVERDFRRAFDREPAVHVCRPVGGSATLASAEAASDD